MPVCPHRVEGRCPICAATQHAGTAAILLGLGAFASACATALYGVPAVDNDGDGYFAGPEDCDDEDASIHPDAEDPEGDGIDQNCDGVDGIADTGN